MDVFFEQALHVIVMNPWTFQGPPLLRDTVGYYSIYSL